MIAEDLEKMLVKDLKELAKSAGIEGYNSMLKKDLIEVLSYD